MGDKITYKAYLGPLPVGGKERVRLADGSPPDVTQATQTGRHRVCG